MSANWATVKYYDYMSKLEPYTDEEVENDPELWAIVEDMQELKATHNIDMAWVAKCQELGI